MGFLWLFARRFVAGETLEAALPRVKEINGKGLSVTLDILGENVTSREEARRYGDNYINLVRTITKEEINGNVSIKPTMMGLDVGDEFCFDNIRRLVEEAAKHENFVRIDMEGSAYTQRTLDLFSRLREQFPNVGIVIQAYLLRSEADIRDINAGGGTVRLCKGAYREPKAIAIKRMKDIRSNFIKLAKLLFGEGAYPAIATHDTRLIRWTKEYVAGNGISRDAFEFQMLYGIRPRLQEELAREGYRMRAYVPYGTHWFPYFYRRLRERKENIWFVLKNLFKK